MDCESSLGPGKGKEDVNQHGFKRKREDNESHGDCQLDFYCVNQSVIQLECFGSQPVFYVQCKSRGLCDIMPGIKYVGAPILSFLVSFS